MSELANPLVVALNPDAAERAIDTTAESFRSIYAELEPQQRAAIIPKLLREVYDGEIGLQDSAVTLALTAVKRVTELRRDVVIQALILALEEERQTLIN